MHECLPQNRHDKYHDKPIFCSKDRACLPRAIDVGGALVAATRTCGDYFHASIWVKMTVRLADLQPLNPDELTEPRKPYVLSKLSSDATDVTEKVDGRRCEAIAIG